MFRTTERSIGSFNSTVGQGVGTPPLGNLESDFIVIVGDAYFKLLRYDQALAAYKRAAVLAPGDEGIKARIGRVMARLGQ